LLHFSTLVLLKNDGVITESCKFCFYYYLRLSSCNA